MRIRHTDIGRDGLRIETSAKPEWLVNLPELTSDEADTRFTSDIELDLQVEKVLQEITISGNISFTIESPCARCLSPVQLTLTPEVNLVLSPGKSDDKSVEYVDFETYTGDDIELDDYLREVIAMSLPVKVVCDEDCAGLCSCGANLNFENCTCNNDRVDPRFSVLRNLKV